MERTGPANSKNHHKIKKEGLRNRLMEEWNRIDINHLQKIIYNMPNTSETRCATERISHEILVLS